MFRMSSGGAARAGIYTALAALVWFGLSCSGSGESAPKGVAQTESVTQALSRSLVWLDANVPDSRADPLGSLCLDAWAWAVFALWHPDPAIVARTGREADRRLRALEPPMSWDLVSLSYWVTALRLMQLLGIEEDAGRRALQEVDVEGISSTGNATSAWWVMELARYSGHPSSPDLSGTFLARASHQARAERVTVRDAVRLYHEVAAATGLGRSSAAFERAQLDFARRAVPALIEVSTNEGDTDAAAEVLIAAALLGMRNTAAYRDGIAWLLARQKEDGTYTRAPGTRPGDYRHVVLVASWALLTSLERFEPMVEGRPR